MLQWPWPLGKFVSLLSGKFVNKILSHMEFPVNSKYWSIIYFRKSQSKFVISRTSLFTIKLNFALKLKQAYIIANCQWTRCKIRQFQYCVDRKIMISSKRSCALMTQVFLPAWRGWRLALWHFYAHMPQMFANLSFPSRFLLGKRKGG